MADGDSFGRRIRLFLGRRRHGREIALIEASGLFDATYYQATYPDVAASGMNPIVHYLEKGAIEGRNPSAAFDTVWYFSENAELAARGVNPLVHYIEWGRSFNVRPAPLNDLQTFDSFERAVHSGRLDGTSLYQAVNAVHCHFDRRPAAGDAEGRPLPPLDLAARVGSETIEDYAAIGADIKTTILRCLDPGFSFEGARCLDFGCGAGRVIRHFGAEAENGEVWGCDIDAASILWCTENLSPPGRFFQLGEAPVLPFESSSFDLVYAIAVFSQVFRDWHTWAMEIRRVLKPGGVFFMSFNGQVPFEMHYTDGRSYADYMRDTGVFVVGPYNPWNRGGPHVVLSHEWVQKVWGAMFDVDFIAAEGLIGFQSIALMRKPAPGAPPKREVPVLALGTQQDFHPDAIGCILPRFDIAKPFRESYGIEAQKHFVVDGWIDFRGGGPERLEAFVDGRPIEVSTTFAAAGGAARADAKRYSFEAACDAGEHAEGRRRLELVLTSSSGVSHRLSTSIAFN